MRPFLAEDCLLPGLAEGPLTRKQILKLDESAAISDPKRRSNFLFGIKPISNAHYRKPFHGYFLHSIFCVKDKVLHRPVEVTAKSGHSWGGA